MIAWEDCVQNPYCVNVMLNSAIPYCTIYAFYLELWAQIHKHCLKMCPKICLKIILGHKLRCCKMILRHVLSQFTKFVSRSLKHISQGYRKWLVSVATVIDDMCDCVVVCLPLGFSL